MATLALAAAGAAAGSALLPAGVTLLGATLTGAALGSQIGALAGSYVDNALFGASGRSKPSEGPRLQNVHVTTSTEGTPIPRIYGRVRLGGQVIWADAITEEVFSSSTSSGSGKGTGLGGGAGTQSIEYRYSASFAVALCEGLIGGLGRVWADGQELDMSRVTARLHIGSETQAADALILARLGAEAAPAFRGMAYVVFQDLPLADFGNRIPQLSFEVFRPVDDFAQHVRGVVLIPGSGEFVYAQEPVTQEFGGGRSAAENVHTLSAPTDWAAALDQLETALPNADAVSLIVSWFGTDLRAGSCQLKPGVERNAKDTAPLTWSVAGVTRLTAHTVSTKDGRPAYGGTPSDQTVIGAIQDLKARGKSAILTPFILMDVPETNALPDPYGGATQPAYPWRGRITVDPAPGRPGTVDKTAAAAAQISALVGTAQVSHFAVTGQDVTYTGPAEFTLRRMVLHYAHLAKAAGGVAAFIIGSELRGLSQIRSAASAFPFVTALVQLASDVKVVLGPGTKVLYAADWSEYFGYQPPDGSGDVFFHLDPLWASPSIDAIGIDCYWPLSDWRDGGTHADYDAGWRSPYDPAYLRANVTGGEGYDWYYASEAARAAQVRTPITDGAGKPWVFRYKDIKNWWLNPHYNRPGGVESAVPTAWIPQSKPFWLTEIGCPAVDKGANQPNVFVDPKSSESALPYFSRGTRDDLIQRRAIEAMISAFDPAHPTFMETANPVSAVYGDRMVTADRILPYCWDARPYPAFPSNLDVWGDGSNWSLGHWLNGRMAGGALDRTLERMLQDYGFDGYTIGSVGGIVHGYAIDRVMAARDAIEPLQLAYFFDTLESGGRIAFRPRGGGELSAGLSEDDLVERRPGEALLELVRGQETDLPASAKIHYADALRDYQPAVAEARRLAGASGRVAQAELPLVLDSQDAQPLADSWLHETWVARERAAFELPPSWLALEPGDVVSVTKGAGTARRLRVTEIADHGSREIAARAVDPDLYLSTVAQGRDPVIAPPVYAGQPMTLFLDLPLMRGDEPANAGYAAVTQTPWPGGIAIYASPEDAGFVLKGLAPARAVIGTTLTALAPGPLGVFDRAAVLRVDVADRQLVSATPLQIFAGSNAAAVRTPEGDWEIIQFQTASLISPGVYDLTGLLRGQAGSEHAMRAPLASGAAFVLLDASLARIDLSPAEVDASLNWRSGPASRPISDPSFINTVHAFRGVGRRPLAPVHIEGRRTGGDLSISWVRRTRSGGDSWSAGDVPLSEDAEAYEVDILDGVEVKRTISVSAPAATYSAAHQTADFGSPQASVSVRVVQLSASAGRGYGRMASL